MLVVCSCVSFAPTSCLLSLLWPQNATARNMLFNFLMNCASIAQSKYADRHQVMARVQRLLDAAVKREELFSVCRPLSFLCGGFGFPAVALSAHVRGDVIHFLRFGFCL